MLSKGKSLSSRRQNCPQVGGSLSTKMQRFIKQKIEGRNLFRRSWKTLKPVVEQKAETSAAENRRPKLVQRNIHKLIQKKAEACPKEGSNLSSKRLF